LKFQFIAEHQQEYPVTTMCRALEISVSGDSAKKLFFTRLLKNTTTNFEVQSHK